MELLRHESLPSKHLCSNCQQVSATHRCQDCFGTNLWCDSCCVSTHANVPFHRVQVWNGQFFEQLDLLLHHLTLDLLHYPDNCSSSPHLKESRTISNLDLSDHGSDSSYNHETQEGSDRKACFRLQSNLTIVSSTGIFKRSVRWCNCARSSDQYVQLLLHAKLFLASFKMLQTVFTFEVLDHFQIGALECTMAAMNFMSKIQRITNEAFPSHVPVGNRI